MFKPNKRLALKALGINIYGGGFTLGVMKHFDILAQWEEIKLGCRTFDANFTGIPRPIVDYTEWPWFPMMNKVPFIYANPPCAPWSDANTHAGQSKAARFLDKRLALTAHTMETAMSIRPLIFISESVGNAYNYGESHYVQYRDAWMKLGYSVTYFLTDAILHGAPCKRRRFHFIAHKHELLLPPIPVMTRDKIRTVRDAIGDLVDVPFNEESQHVEVSLGRWSLPQYRKLFKLVRPNARLCRSLPPGFDGPKPSMFIYRACWDWPSHTVMGFDKVIHPDAKRTITRREGLRLATYPDEFMVGANGHDDIGAYDAVIPVMGEMLAQTAKRTILARQHRKPQFEVIDWRPLGKPWHCPQVKKVEEYEREANRNSRVPTGA